LDYFQQRDSHSSVGCNVMDVQVMDAQVMRTSLEQGEPCKGDALRLHFAQVMSTPLKRNGC